MAGLGQRRSSARSIFGSYLGWPLGTARRFALLAHPVYCLVLAKSAQLEMADLKDRFGNFDGESTSHQQWPADILAEEFQPTKDVNVPPDNTEIETIARANIAVSGIAVV
jgi:hypothetical protein